MTDASHSHSTSPFLGVYSQHLPKMPPPDSISQFLSQARTQERDTEQDLQASPAVHNICTFNTWISQPDHLRLHVWGGGLGLFFDLLPQSCAWS